MSDKCMSRKRARPPDSHQACFGKACAGYEGAVPSGGMCDLLETLDGEIRYDGNVLDANRDAPSAELAGAVRACATAFTGPEGQDREVPVYIVVAHSSYDSVFGVVEKEIKFSRDGTLFEVPHGSFYVSASPTGWGMVDGNDNKFGASSTYESEDHILRGTRERIMEMLFSPDYTCKTGRDAGSATSRIELVPHGEDRCETDWGRLQALASALAASPYNCPGLITNQPGYFLPQQWTYNKEHHFYGDTLTLGGFGIIKLTKRGSSAFTIPRPGGPRTRLAESHVRTAGQLFFVSDSELTEGDLECWEMMRERTGAEAPCFASEITSALSGTHDKPAVVITLSCSEFRIFIGDRPRQTTRLNATAPPQDANHFMPDLAVMTLPDVLQDMLAAGNERQLRDHFRSGRNPFAIPPDETLKALMRERLMMARLMKSMCVASLQLQTNLHTNSGGLWDWVVAGSLERTYVEQGMDERPWQRSLTAGWATGVPGEECVSFERLISTDPSALISAESAAAELVHHLAGELSCGLIQEMPCFYARDFVQGATVITGEQSCLRRSARSTRGGRRKRGTRSTRGGRRKRGERYKRSVRSRRSMAA